MTTIFIELKRDMSWIKDGMSFFI